MNAAEELLGVSDAASAALAELDKDEIKQPLAVLELTCDEAKRAWSGSNIGYHADVYWERLELRSPPGQFSPEWGLMDRWPTHQPASGWGLMEPSVVRELLLYRAGNPNLDYVDSVFSAATDTFSDLKETALSVITSLPLQDRDVFIARKQKEVEKLFVAAQQTIAQSALPTGEVMMTRDSTAMTQGLRVAPHQRLAAVYLSVTVARNALKSLKNMTRDVLYISTDWSGVGEK